MVTSTILPLLNSPTVTRGLVESKYYRNRGRVRIMFASLPRSYRHSTRGETKNRRHHGSREGVIL